MQRYNGRIVWVDGKPFGVAERLSPSVKIFAQDTGRWSQTGPPMAQLPVKMRKIIGVDAGWSQVGYDLSNAELRIVAELSGDDMFLAAFAQGWDLHTLNACELFGMDYPPSRLKNDIHTSEICAEWRIKYDWQGEDDARRKFGKIFNFRTLYGGSPKTAYQIPGAGKLGLSRSELEQSGYRWLAAHPKLTGFWEHHGIEAQQRFCTRNAYGRRRVLCSQDDLSRWREGVNHPVQSFVSDLVNEIVVQTFCELNCLTLDDKGCYEWVESLVTAEMVHPLREQPNTVRLCGQMHDSLLWAFPNELFEGHMKRALAIAERPRILGQWTFQFPVSYYTKNAPEILYETEVLRG